MGAFLIALCALAIVGTGDAAGTQYSRPYNSDCITLAQGQTGVSLFPKKYMIQGDPMVTNNNGIQVGRLSNKQLPGWCTFFFSVFFSFNAFSNN